MSSEAENYPAGSIFRDAALAKLFMNQSARGGLNSFLTNNWDVDAVEVVNALRAIGANSAADQLDVVLRKLGGSLPRATQDERWHFLEKHWKDEMNDYDTLSGESYRDLMEALESHVNKNKEFYESLK